MRSNKAIFVIIIISLSIMGCENVIKLDLKNTEPRLVIEGIISDQHGETKFIISKTTDYFNPSVFPSVSGAQVIISDSAQNIDTLRESQPGIYLPYRFIRGISGHTYRASVTVEGKTYTASTYMPYPVSIYAVRTTYQDGGGFGSDADAGYRLLVWFIDPAGIDNFCRIRVTKNDSILSGYYLFDDKYSDGDTITYDYFGEIFAEGDSIKVDIISMDKAVYDYFLTLTNDVAWEEGSDPQMAPANPNTNWSGDALGYFGAFSVDTRTLVIWPDK